ncbi:hypothetical protein [Parapedomonas caeni]
MTDRTRIDECLATFGADLTRWPAEEAAAARALGDDTALAVRRADEAWLDAALSDWPVMKADPTRIEALLARVEALPAVPVNAPAASSTSWATTFRQRYWLTGGAMLAVAASIAAVLLIAPPRQATPVTLTDEAALSMVFSTEQSEGWSEGWM